MMTSSMHYYRPLSITEAVRVYRDLEKAGRNPQYLSGGTEILTRRRVHEIYPNAVVDLKGIPEVKHHGNVGDSLVFGAGLTLMEIVKAGHWGLLSATVDRVADHTSRGQITLGGNIASHLPYREAALPFMVVDSAIMDVATAKGVVSRPFATGFNGTLRLNPAEFIVALRVPREVADQPYASWKMTRMDWIDYPLVTIAGIRYREKITVAFSGYGTVPFRHDEIDAVLSRRQMDPIVRTQQAIRAIPTDPISDMHGSAAYRKFVTQYTLESLLRRLEGRGITE